MSTQPTDPIISEVRSVRNAHVARFDYDLSAIFQNIRAMQGKSGRRYISLPSRPSVSSDTKPGLSSKETVGVSQIQGLHEGTINIRNVVPAITVTWHEYSNEKNQHQGY